MVALNEQLERKYRHLSLIRTHELKMVLSYIPSEARVLEIGAGAGWQARALSDYGCQVVAVDVLGSGYRKALVWPVILYDGSHLPLADNSVDVVFSSNVLEHISTIRDFQSEIRRVLKPSGLAIHVMLSTGWRFWTTLAFYPFAVKRLFEKMWERLNWCKSDRVPLAERNVSLTTNRSTSNRWNGRMWPTRHGERGNVITELYYFSKYYWLNLFTVTGWRVKEVFPNEMFRTGYILLGPRLGLSARRYLSRFMGHSCLFYIVEPNDAS
jgi:SAM-dependent methyltransferase